MLDRIISFVKQMNALNIERAYKRLDQAVNQLRAYNDDEESVNKEDLDALVEMSLEDADRILANKGEKAWDGMYREMHEYLTKIYMELHEYEKAEENARYVGEYDRSEGEYLKKQIEAHKRGERIEDFDPGAVDEAEE